MKNVLISVCAMLIFASLGGCGVGMGEVPRANIEPIRSVRIAISGDAMHHLPQITAARLQDNSLDYDYVFSDISKLWKSVDFTVVNLETTLSTTPPYYGYPSFRSPQEFMIALHDAGATTFALANNHCVDMSADGVRRTLALLRQRNINYVGLSDDTTRNAIVWFKKESISVALLNYTYGTNGLPIPKGMQVNLIDTTLIRKDYINARKQGADFVITLLHWGYEYQLRYHKEQEELGLWCRNLGLDYVVGSHPHVVQYADTKNRIIYSLGNLVSAQYMPYTQGGITIVLEFFSNETLSAKFVPHWVDIKDRYRIRMPWDTIKTRHEELNYSLEQTRKIVTGAN